MDFFRSPLKQIFATLLTSSHSHGNKSVKAFSLSTLSQAPSSCPTANLLIDSLGLSPDSALKAAQAIRVEPIATSGALIAVFKSYGFSSCQIVRIFTRNPPLLRSNPKRTVEPKLAFLSESGIPSENLCRIISATPMVLHRSLPYVIMPCIKFLKTFFGNTGDVVSHLLLKSGTQVLLAFSEAMGPNIETLRYHGVPDKNIQRMLIVRPTILSLDVHRFSGIVREAKEMGLDASGMRFIYTISTVSMMTEDKWISKVEVFKNLGWSEEQVYSLITKTRHLHIMQASEQKLRRSLNQLSDMLNWGPREVLKNPSLILKSGEKTILPRYHVLQKLISMHLLKVKNINSAAYTMNEDKFLNRYVRCYLQDIPELLDLYHKSKLKSRN